MTPWLAKNVIDTGNPVYPLGHQVFGGRYWNSAMDQKWANVHGRGLCSLSLFWNSLVDVAGRSDWQSPLYVALAPLAFIRKESRWLAIVVAAYVAYIFLSWWFLTHRLDRFWLPLLPGFAVLAGLGADWTRNKLWSIFIGFVMTIVIITNLAYSTTALTALNEWTGRPPRTQAVGTGAAQQIPDGVDSRLPPDARILLVGQAAVFHVQHPIVYNTVFDDDNFEVLTRDKSPDEVRTNLETLGITHVFVDWFEIERYRSPGNYGFTPYVTPAVFEKLVKAGVLGPAEEVGTRQQLYPVRATRS